MNNFDIQFQEIWQDLLRKYPQAQSNTNPMGFVLGGQPGAGKSKLLEKIANNLNGNVLVINADEFRRYHPKFDEIQTQYGDEAPKYTAEFSGKMAERVLNTALSEKYNIAIEGTFRTTETPLKTIDLMKNQGYKIAVHIQTCPKEISWQSTIERYEAMKKAGLTPRAVDKGHHDLVCDNLGENADKVLQSGKTDEFKVFNRDTLIFDAKTNNNLPSQIINLELNKTSLQNEIQNAQKLLSQNNPKLQIRAELPQGIFRFTGKILLITQNYVFQQNSEITCQCHDKLRLTTIPNVGENVKINYSTLTPKAKVEMVNNRKLKR